MLAGTRQLNVYEWMLIHGEELAAAIKADGRLDGPTAEPLLNEAQSLDAPGKTKHEARKLLQLQLGRIGAGGLMK